ncbi:MAG: transcription antitermination factor NusB [Gemmatimonadetes bacterium]|nr:transcription antitermination factor NusB [Gemmatimonadota bacterium]
MRARSRARGWAVQVLYAWEAHGRSDSPVDVLAEFLRERRIAETSREYLDQLIRRIAEHRREIDGLLQDALTNWRLERLSAIDRNILRIATAEMLFLRDVPARVSIQEAIVLAEKYGTGESPRFVNGVLDAVMHRLEQRPGRSAGRREGS